MAAQGDIFLLVAATGAAADQGKVNKTYRVSRVRGTSPNTWYWMERTEGNTNRGVVVPESELLDTAIWQPV